MVNEKLRKNGKYLDTTYKYQSNEINKIKIRKNQIDTHWQFAKEEADIHCKKFIEFFIIFLTIGFTIIITVITEKIEPFQWYFLIGIYFIGVAFYSILKINETIKSLKIQCFRFHYELEELK